MEYCIAYLDKNKKGFIINELYIINEMKYNQAMCRKKQMIKDGYKHVEIFKSNEQHIPESIDWNYVNKNIINEDELNEDCT